MPETSKKYYLSDKDLSLFPDKNSKSALKVVTRQPDMMNDRDDIIAAGMETTSHTLVQRFWAGFTSRLLTMAVYVPKFVVQVKQASDAVLHRRDWPVSR